MTTTAHPPLDAIFWNALTGAQARFATGAGGARRYAPGFSPIIAFADNSAPDFTSLAPFCAPGEVFYCEGWQGACPPGWRIDAETSMDRMVWQGDAGMNHSVDDSAAALTLGAADVDDALALATLCRPGPFGPRTPELGLYLGYREDQQQPTPGRLIAMAGQRMRVPGYTEISGVCTHPDAQGRGLARALMSKLIAHQMQRGERPFLHVMRANVAAHAFYERLGFVDYVTSTVRVLTRLA